MYYHQPYDYTGVVIVSLIIYGVIFAFACRYLAIQKGRDPTDWAVIGFFLGVIGLLMIGFASKNEEVPKSELDFSTVNPNEHHFDSENENTVFVDQYGMKKCPACAELIKIDALKCRYCGEIFDEKSVKKLLENYLSVEERKIYNGLNQIRKQYKNNLSKKGILLKLSNDNNMSETQVLDILSNLKNKGKI